ncbi:SusD/RagB family nutrient-binding outer membrane lipoprotein [Pararcticibacter amylolyticus]|uniref:SusD/RagB family nutrient-binding outer membrane lipoprotein n=1 Tax=Pararcticibacter amylolyticus TaxID=2173175 RepID=A0A2U2PFC5_9SPHI|nr:SusD/RagB family nutrient-binding outer membrane lipoprotein [Pararcticibacter amylolyticus]PWG80105.1 SusD/RagB family nutrient-binding outer membrane lipoprotein [Pararcticibacter amylolyticus]
MKTLIIKISFLGLMLITVLGCENELEERYNNPEQSSVPSIPGYFTALINNNRVRPSYYEFRTFLFQHASVYSQTIAFPRGMNTYLQDDKYSGERWRDFYSVTYNDENKDGTGILAIYRQMEKSFNELPEAEKANNEVFMHAARVFVYDQASQMVDMWGDIPFSETGSLIENSTISNPKFDDAKELYSLFLNELKNEATYFATASLSTVASSGFKKQDIIIKGDMPMWRKYANSIRLRLLMRISFSDESTARQQVMEMLGSPGDFPIIDGDNSGSYNPVTKDVLLAQLTTNNKNLNSALFEIASYYAPDYMLNTVMLPANDPRIPVMFDKFGETVQNKFVPNAEYRAMPVSFTSEEQTANFRKYSIVDSSTFMNNLQLPGILFTASEGNFLKSEAFERWGGGDAQVTYETAVRQSVVFYYYLNSLGNGPKAPLEKPTESEISSFLSKPTIAYTGTSEQKLAKTWTQKWLHFGFLQSVQAWAEYRRTKYPQLTFPNATRAGYERPPSRLTYPSVEQTYNSSYEAVRSKDVRTNKIFWDVR